MSGNVVGFSDPVGPGPKPEWVIGVGVVLVALGVFAWADVVVTTLASVVVLGVLIIFAGVAQLMHAFVHRVPGSGQRGPGIDQVFAGLLGVLYLLAGSIMIEEPATGSVVLTAVLAGCLIVAGLSRAIWAAGHRRYGAWWAAAASGVFTLLIGVLLYVSLPWSGLMLLGSLIAIEFVVAGVSAILFALSLRRAEG